MEPKGAQLPKWTPMLVFKDETLTAELDLSDLVDPERNTFKDNVYALKVMTEWLKLHLDAMAESDETTDWLHAALDRQGRP